MALSDTAARAGTGAQRLLENQYAQERLNEAMQNLRAAYKRGSKRRVKPAEDKKIREQVRQAAASANEAAKALRSGRQQPKKRRGRRVLIVLGLGGVGAAVALAADENLRKKVLGDGGASAVSGDDLVTPAQPATGTTVGTPTQSATDGA
jgi:hypothetical protein